MKAISDTRIALADFFGRMGEVVASTRFRPAGTPISELVQNGHNIAFARQATAAGTLKGQELGSAAQAVLGTGKNGQICVGCSSYGARHAGVDPGSTEAVAVADPAGRRSAALIHR